MNLLGNVYSCGSSCIGASHKKNSKPMQDYSFRCQFGNNNDNLLFVISDGHGSDPYFRSHIGSKLAVEITTEKIKAFVSEFEYEDKWPDFIQRGVNGITDKSNIDYTDPDRYNESVFRHLFEVK